MVEELKIVADILKGITDGAIQGVIAYLIFAYIKPVTLYGIGSFTIIKVFTLLSNRPKNVIEIDKL